MNHQFLGSLAGAAFAPGAIPDPLRADLSALYALSQSSRFVFASPLGPFPLDGRQAYLPRFVFFGPNACDESWRLALLAGFDHGDHRASRALVALATRLAADSETGHGLNLSFFPLVDVAGLVTGAPDRALGSAHWGRGGAPEIELLEQDARVRGYHGFVRIETEAKDDDLIGLRVRGPFAGLMSPDLELISSEETRSFPIRFESVAGDEAPTDGPLSVADDLPVDPFELTLRIPAAWSDEAYQHAAVTLLERFLRRYRAFQAYGQHL
jgi:hypothetical protein